MSDIGAILETGGAAAVELAASALTERGGKLGTCANCHEPLIGPYCAVCGQPRDVHRRSIWGLLHDLFKDIASFDSRILRTARALMLQPGELARAYHEGRTQPFVPPVRLYLFVSLIFFLVLSATHIALFQFSLHLDKQVWSRDATGHVFLDRNGQHIPVTGFTAAPDGHLMVHGRRVGHDKIGDTTYTVSAPPMLLQRTGHVPPLPPPVMAQLREMQRTGMSEPGNGASAQFQRSVALTMTKLAQDPAALNAPMTEWLPRLLFLLMPLFALILSLFYRVKGKYFFVDHLVFSLNYHSFGFAFLLLVLAPAQLLPLPALLLLLNGGMGLYLLLAMKRFYGESWLRTTLKFLAFAFIYLFFILGPAFAGLLAVSVIYG